MNTSQECDQCAKDYLHEFGMVAPRGKSKPDPDHWEPSETGYGFVMKNDEVCHGPELSGGPLA
jgi:hypothetical protein